MRRFLMSQVGIEYWAPIEASMRGLGLIRNILCQN